MRIQSPKEKRENTAGAMFEEMAKTDGEHQATDLKIATNLEQSEYRENHTQAHYSKTDKNQIFFFFFRYNPPLGSNGGISC